MGIGYHGLQFLRFAAKHSPLGRVATIGRQAIFLDANQIRTLVDGRTEFASQTYCEDLLLHHFGALSVDSWDNSDYEGASRIADMNEPLPDASPRYNTVLDAGSLEHVYNVPQALSNVSDLCCDGGQILHILPANNFCGHGFWQFSPELFFSLYSDANGYQDTRVFLANEYRTDVWYEVHKPAHGRRVDIVTFTPVFALCRTVKTRAHSHRGIQQSDYLYLWNQAAATAQPSVESVPPWQTMIKNMLQSSGIVDFAYMLHIKWSSVRALSSRNPQLTTHSINALLAPEQLAGNQQSGRLQSEERAVADGASALGGRDDRASPQ